MYRFTTAKCIAIHDSHFLRIVSALINTLILPKGVVLAHRNLVATMKCLMFMVMPRDDIYIAFLPLAHVLELLAENTMMLFGVKVGYSSPNTMTDMSTKVRKGYKGDATVLRPTMMCAVPLIMDRIYKNILDSG